MQLLIVAVSLPMMSVIQISHSSKTVQSKQDNETVKKSKQNEMDAYLLKQPLELNKMN